MPAEPVKYIGDKLVVGQIDYSFLPAVPAIPGSSILNGPVWIGAGGPQLPIANCMIGPGLHPITLQITGITNVAGVVNRVAVANVTGLTSKIGITLRNALSLTNGINVKNSLNEGTAVNNFKKVNVDTSTDCPLINCDNLNFTGKIFGGSIDVASIKASFGAFSSVAAPFKQFNIPHPTKENMRLVHVSLEGPEIGVYYRGRLVDSTIISLPDYWKGLVDAETITVNLTPHGSYQELYYEIVNWGTEIRVINNSGGRIDCSYIVHAERKDVEKLVVEQPVEENKVYPESIK
jgi:hypothetical protein